LVIAVPVLAELPLKFDREIDTADNSTFNLASPQGGRNDLVRLGLRSV